MATIIIPYEYLRNVSDAIDRNGIKEAHVYRSLTSKSGTI